MRSRSQCVPQAALSVLLGALALCNGAAAQAQSPIPAPSTLPVLETIASFFSVGGYFFTGSNNHNAVGRILFRNDASYFSHSIGLGVARVSGGLQFYSARDHFFPFSGGSGLSLIGPAARITTIKVMNRVRLVATAGLYVGDLRSVRQGFDTTFLTPSMEAGVELPFARYFTLTAGYRVGPTIHGVDTSGFALGLKFF